MKYKLSNVIPTDVIDVLLAVEASVDPTERGPLGAPSLLKYVPIQFEHSSLYEVRDKGRGLYDPYQSKYEGLESGLVMACRFDTVPGLREVVNDAIGQIFDTIDGESHQFMGDFFRISRYVPGQHVRIHVDDYDDYNLGFLIIFKEPAVGGEFVLDGTDVGLHVGDMLLFSNGVPHEVLPIVEGNRLAAFGRFKLIQ